MQLHSIETGKFKLDGGAMFGIIPKPLWEKKINPDELNRIDMSLRVLFIETKNKKILIDTGIGDYHSEKFKDQFDIQGGQSPVEKILKAKFNVDADQITDIIITHLHFDHVGGLGKADGKELVFKNATIHLHEDHYNYAQKPTVRDSGSFQSHFFNPILDQYKAKGQIHFVDNESGVLIEDGNNKDERIMYKTSFGHTPYMLHPYTDKYIYMADLVPMAHHVRIPWVMGYDIEPGITTEYKESFYQFIIENKLSMIFEHDKETWGGKLGLKDGRYSLEAYAVPENSEALTITE